MSVNGAAGSWARSVSGEAPPPPPCPAMPGAIPLGRGPAAGATRAGGAAHGPPSGAGPGAATRSRSEASPAAAAVTLAREYASLCR